VNCARGCGCGSVKRVEQRFLKGRASAETRSESGAEGQRALMRDGSANGSKGHSFVVNPSVER